MKKFAFLFFGLLICSGLFAQEDAEGCKDHPLLTRLNGFNIVDCVMNYNQLDFLNTSGEWVTIEGYLTTINYIFTSDGEMPSNFQIIKNYLNAVTAIGGKKVYTDDNYGCFQLKKNGKESKIMISEFVNGNQFKLQVLEMDAMVQEITANAMLEALNTNGSIALNILFDTGKSTIKSESFPIVDQIFEMMNGATDLKISIEGHTDNVGDIASNKTLSQNRSKAVMDALVAKGVDKTRMSSLGWGQEKPVADNATDEGKTQNRRVEIVKK